MSLLSALWWPRSTPSAVGTHPCTQTPSALNQPWLRMAGPINCSPNRHSGWSQTSHIVCLSLTLREFLVSVREEPNVSTVLTSVNTLVTFCFKSKFVARRLSCRLVWFVWYLGIHSFVACLCSLCSVYLSGLQGPLLLFNVSSTCTQLVDSQWNDSLSYLVVYFLLAVNLLAICLV